MKGRLLEFLQESKYQSLSDDILAAKEKGQEAMDDFIQKRLEGDKPQTNFLDPISKMKLSHFKATFSSLH